MLVHFDKFAPKYYVSSILCVADIWEKKGTPNLSDLDKRVILFNIQESCVENPLTGVFETIEDILNVLIKKRWTRKRVAKWLRDLIPMESDCKDLTVLKKSDTV